MKGLKYRFDKTRPVVSHSEVLLPHKIFVTNNIGGALKGPQIHLWKEVLFVQHYKKYKINLLLDPLSTNLLSNGTRVLGSIIAPGINKCGCYSAWKYFAHHFANGNLHVKGIDFDWSYIPISHADSFSINVAISEIHRLITRVLDVINDFQNKIYPVKERVCITLPLYYLDWFDK